MVHLVINENATYESNDELLELVESLKKENEDLKSIVMDMKNEISTINHNYILLSDLVEKNFKKMTVLLSKKETSTVKSTTSQNVKEGKILKKEKKGRRVTDDDIYIPNKSLQTEWKYLVLNEDTGEIWNMSSHKYKLRFTFNELLYIIECDTPLMISA